jgi:hypothetical protein
MDLLVLIVDLSPFQWGKRIVQQQLNEQQKQQKHEQSEQTETNEQKDNFDICTLTICLEHICMYLNAFQLLNQHNQIAIIGTDHQKRSIKTQTK